MGAVDDGLRDGGGAARPAAGTSVGGGEPGPEDEAGEEIGSSDDDGDDDDDEQDDDDDDDDDDEEESEDDEAIPAAASTANKSTATKSKEPSRAAQPALRQVPSPRAKADGLSSLTNSMAALRFVPPSVQRRMGRETASSSKEKVGHRATGA